MKLQRSLKGALFMDAIECLARGMRGPWHAPAGRVFALAEARVRLGYHILQERYFQYLFARQWQSLRRYCAELGISIMGDAPIYVSLDSCDVWANREIFVLDDLGLPVYAAGAPAGLF